MPAVGALLQPTAVGSGQAVGCNTRSRWSAAARPRLCRKRRGRATAAEGIPLRTGWPPSDACSRRNSNSYYSSRCCRWSCRSPCTRVPRPRWAAAGCPPSPSRRRRRIAAISGVVTIAIVAIFCSRHSRRPRRSRRRPRADCPPLRSGRGRPSARMAQARPLTMRFIGNLHCRLLQVIGQGRPQGSSGRTARRRPRYISRMRILVPVGPGRPDPADLRLRPKRPTGAPRCAAPAQEGEIPGSRQDIPRPPRAAARPRRAHPAEQAPERGTAGSDADEPDARIPPAALESTP